MEAMIIKDLTGKEFTINDIEGSIAIVKEFLSYQTTADTLNLKRLDESVLRYWNDFYEKLLGLQQKASEKQ
ncbi:hypothetical protein MTO98_09500 [Mucilaginibacter sp. SMC90]|uniref:hypothetical protein n=1 Tax=Mucilaginibacter sp. SMC90 TaxID=2929803 RepID=UPI001FB4CB09|nr:hypothetical protein [Mucilaginibacter sp. SMC90]UOE51312.1 hypothetical protein MTO98_09500 [Mucilaginibacter sp. SMC90]